MATEPHVIRLANPQDYQAIAAWLLEEAKILEGRGFHHHLTQIREGIDQGEVAVVVQNEIPIAFACRWWIFETRPEFRRRGYGAALVNYCLAKAVDEERPGVEIECCPKESEPFWKHFGFETFPDKSGRLWGIKLLPRHNPFVAEGAIETLKIDLRCKKSVGKTFSAFETRIQRSASYCWVLEYTYAQHIPYEHDAEVTITFRNRSITLNAKEDHDFGWERTDFKPFVQLATFDPYEWETL